MPKTLQVSPELLQKLARAADAIDDLRDAFEDQLIASNPGLLRKLRRARKDDLSGKVRPFEDLYREFSE